MQRVPQLFHSLQQRFSWKVYVRASTLSGAFGGGFVSFVASIRDPWRDPQTRRIPVFENIVNVIGFTALGTLGGAVVGFFSPLLVPAGAAVLARKSYDEWNGLPRPLPPPKQS
jgi:hypothetical protein